MSNTYCFTLFGNFGTDSPGVFEWSGVHANGQVSQLESWLDTQGWITVTFPHTTSRVRASAVTRIELGAVVRRA